MRRGFASANGAVHLRASLARELERSVGGSAVGTVGLIAKIERHLHAALGGVVDDVPDRPARHVGRRIPGALAGPA